MERNHSTTRSLPLAVAAALGLCLALPLAAQDMTEGTRLGNRADKASTPTLRKDAKTSAAADQRFLQKATAGNEKEVAAATVGQQKAVSRDVRDFAARLLRDHQDMLVKLDETSVALGVSNTRRYTAMTGWGSGMAATGNTAAGGTLTGDTVTGTGAPATDAGATASSAGSTGYETNTMASTDANTAATGSTSVQAVPASASQDPMVRKLAAQSGAAFDRAFVDHMVADHKKDIAEFERASKDTTLSAQTRELASNALPTLRSHLALAESLRSNLSGAGGSR
jgi:putative membrane protein